MHPLVILALVVLVLIALGVVICFCYSHESSLTCPTALRLSTAHSVAGLYNGYADGKTATTTELTSPAECSYSSTIELYDSTFQITEPSCRFAPAFAGREPRGRRLVRRGGSWRGDMVHGDVTLEKLDSSSRRTSSVLSTSCPCVVTVPGVISLQWYPGANCAQGQDEPL
uniref:Putative conserved plasma membrane protein n=1 Tax=Ixodes ricinus TaxID=34613 RepID=A0A090XB86_IXORI